MNYKKSFTLLELLFVIFIGSIFFAYTFIYTKNIYEVDKQNKKITILKLDLNAAKIILEKNIKDVKNKLIYSENNLYFKGNILLKNVTFFSQKVDKNFIQIKLNLNNTITQSWIFKL